MANEIASTLVGKHIEVTFRGVPSTKQFERVSGVVMYCDGANIMMRTKGKKEETMVFSISSARHITFA